ncbi:MAG: RecQ family ATP-dependent DNA helicase [Thermoanaerobaculia bacterium]|nr:RecQ family ATP-dependent DNA helicase [Thermoanaerobaculia bacterium]
MKRPAAYAEPLPILRQYWGYPAFRPLQEDIIRSVLEGRDTLALLPTGGGKSVCYQVPALCRDGLCLVISPLIALMKDQVQQLQKRGIAAAAVHTGMSRRELDIVIENACNDAYKLLYLSPERLQTELIRERAGRMKVNLLAVDEAHCVSQWGYDFRPPYLQITDFRQLLPGVPLLALTATATPPVVKDIQEKLGFERPNVFQQSFARQNLSYSVLYENKKREKLLDILRNVPGSGLIYLKSRGETKEIARFLQENRVSADFYHAGLTPQERSAKQESWMSGRARIMACTNAFGMGIDKPDVRIVIHLGLPESLEAYFQEAGRAGRDGKKSYSVLLYTPGDAETLRYHLRTAYPELDQIRRAYQALGSYTQLAIGAGAGESYDFDFPHFCQTYQIEQGVAHAALRLLEQEGWISITDTGGMPARLRISASREALYDYQLRNKQADTVTKVLLRAYPGIQRDFSDISLLNVAKYANLPYETVEQTLLLAQKEGILDYLPQKDKPQLTFLRERVSPDRLELNTALFNFRKQRAEERVEAAIRYAETRRCRGQQLLSYFGEQDSAACGICDVCTGRNESDVPADVFASLERKIISVLRQEKMPPEEVMKAFPRRRHDQVAKVMSYLLDEGVLIADEAGRLTCSER